ncbi:hypothetical protein OS493_000526 [Desmophyllum pertusum]|uniref:Uncharacterized protein n=1 Tax=Desmophyllum pertusum TaxID=174260 RepID=A0A9X0A819_9CNID|nr:hypothetical protein OS493_000526 [Desmophyllum pertusum]
MQSQNEEFSDQETPTAATEDRDLMRQLMAEVAEMRKENQQLKSEVAKIKTQPRRQLFKRSKDCDPECSESVQGTFEESTPGSGGSGGSENQLNFDLSTSFESPSNQAMAKKVQSEVRSVYGKEKWKKAIIRGNKFLANPFSLKKLSRRISSLEKTPLSDKDKEKAQEILCSPNAVEYMSSEESDNDDDSTQGPKARKIRKLAWEKSKLRNIKSRIDEAYLEGLSERQRRTSARVSRTEEPSARPCPTNGPSWAVRTDN